MRNLMCIRMGNRKRGAVLVIFALSLLAMMGLAALAIDLGAIYSAKAQLQSGADSAALAAVHELGTPNVQTVAAQFAHLNSVMTTPITLGTGDVVTGAFDFDTGIFMAGATEPNAVRVRTRRTADSPDGEFDLFFGRVLGYNSVPVQAQSVAALDRRVNGVTPATGDNQYDLLPFTARKEDVGHLEDANGNNLDQISFEIDTETGTVIVYERVDLRFQVLASLVTYGAGGPEIEVFPSVSITGGTSYMQMNEGRDVDGGENLYLTNVDDPSQIVVKARALYKKGKTTYFDATRYSNQGDDHVVVLRRGDIAPDYAAFDNQTPLNAFIAPYLGENREVNIGCNDVMFLFEFNPQLNTAAADFQDLVIVCTFSRVATEVQQIDYSETTFVANVGATIDFFPDAAIDAPGNWGTVSLDAVSNSTAVLCNYIENGYDKPFTIPTDPGYMFVKGDPGMSNGLRASMESRMGDTVLLLVQDQVSGQGSNTYYRVPYIVAVELTDMDLNGASGDRYIRGVVKSLASSNFVTTAGAPKNTALATWRMAK